MLVGWTSWQFSSLRGLSTDHDVLTTEIWIWLRTDLLQRRERGNHLSQLLWQIVAFLRWTKVRTSLQNTLLLVNGNLALTFLLSYKENFLCVLCVCVGVCSVVSDSLQPLALSSTRLLCPWNLPGKNTEVGCHLPLQEIFLTQGVNLHLWYLLHWQVDSLPLAPPGKSHKESVGVHKYFSVGHVCTAYGSSSGLTLSPQPPSSQSQCTVV